MGENFRLPTNTDAPRKAAASSFETRLTEMNDQTSKVPFKFRLGELTLGSVSRRLAVIKTNPFRPGETDDDTAPTPPRGADGTLRRSMPIDQPLAKLTLTAAGLRYVPRQYERFFVNLETSYDEYLKTFSSKSRSTLRRKVRKFAERSGGAIDWKSYESPGEVEEFYEHARAISRLTYQERLLDAGLPDDDAFRRNMIDAAGQGGVRGYLVFLDAQPIAYLYCPVSDDVMTYAYLGYRPETSELSPGTVLLWLAMEALFEERAHRIFDFTEGGDDSKHSQKRLFSTDSVRCADIYDLKLRPVNAIVVGAQIASEFLAETSGRLLDRFGVKARVRQWTRRRFRPAEAPNGS